MPAEGLGESRLPLRIQPDSIFGVGSRDAEIYQGLSDLSQSIAGHGDLETLCNSLAGALRHVVVSDLLGLILHDPAHDGLLKNVAG